MDNCILCGKAVQRGGYSSRIGGVVLRPLCGDCDELCSKEPKRVAEEYQGVFEKMLAERRETLTATSDTRGLPQEIQRPQRERKMLKRYRDYYTQANAIVSIGDAIKVIGIVLAGVVVLAALLLMSQTKGDPAFGVLFLGAITAITIGVVCYTLGMLVAALGQMLLAIVDIAVNSSPFLTDDLKAEVLSV